MVANFVRLNVNPDKGIFEYVALFEPSIDGKEMRFKLFNQHRETLSPGSIFDGATLYLPCQLPNQVFLLLNYLKTIFHF